MNNFIEYNRKSHIYSLLAIFFIHSHVITASDSNSQNNNGLSAQQIGVAAFVGAIVGITIVKAMQSRIEFDVTHKKIDILNLENTVAQKKYETELVHYKAAQLEQPTKELAATSENLKLKMEFFKAQNEAATNHEQRLLEYIQYFTDGLNKCENTPHNNGESCEQNRRLVILAQKKLEQVLQK